MKKSIVILFAALFLILILTKKDIAAPPTFSYTSSVVGEGSIDPPGGEHKRNWYLTLTAIPADGWQFDHWEGDLSGSNNPENLRITSDKHLIAVFTEIGGPVPTPTPSPEPTPTPTASPEPTLQPSPT